MVKEFNKCPDCGSTIIADNPQFHGHGVMTRYIECENCTWNGTENWELESTEVL